MASRSRTRAIWRAASPRWDQTNPWICTSFATARSKPSASNSGNSWTLRPGNELGDFQAAHLGPGGPARQGVRLSSVPQQRALTARKKLVAIWARKQRRLPASRRWRCEEPVDRRHFVGTGAALIASSALRVAPARAGAAQRV